MVSFFSVSLCAKEIERWGVFELALPGPADSATNNPYVDVQWSATFTQGSHAINLHWYFTSPMDAPGDAEVRLDRTLTSHNGVIGPDVQELAIGNFDQSMHRYGLSATENADVNPAETLTNSTMQRNLQSMSRSMRVSITIAAAVVFLNTFHVTSTVADRLLDQTRLGPLFPRVFRSSE